MRSIRQSIPDVVLIEPEVFGDSRGFFYESFNQRAFHAATGSDCVFVQDNHSRSSQGVLRGLHYQLPPRAQGKLVRVVQGAVFDVAADIRRDSPTFGAWVGALLTQENHRQLWIPPGLAHGFLVLSGSADFVYKTTDYYSPEHERCIRWDDPRLAIAWPALEGEIRLSAKDRAGCWLAEAVL
ncbi:dTDP-4-dehydrorhamnose 3,5-epimerase [Verminephrobacter aporrectodeae]|uniref:dTDP-4-dehydrorhamnose 3,5-epimerase n=1 Tax=Verminephrobacter aporrectodeae subsp. tuberculatae TaxID=1110392 RepID=A0ABT3KT98_9BURK|nr:dTDP-4-dehydrorhamnose 3,5-epimerase [Verminephrobacter aporrectodeae]MCW5222516.1 dTDP-4-dehydrorhamnose 3,5-epimerase [Verminephrobacter aporrectodeae subsp. tuberculatae]MCW5257275.1 dTDP-4-dehydrorhamnose 3,5-epimerase [Verminephrobacter aporrectodeae subsp. tuberculatae]MCW5287981.1 dTDP-4-dehydrorhamnose 3,5-epimerase [Verminephrobacter aporrectodeae subsp. tuberculatae]MCW5321541.1 dTDP-4-dehydrorhamnose 3,5-epimerase [Verminephrobacter aporrectodeae subsp. tuberculatae]MCW8166892.1 